MSFNKFSISVLTGSLLMSSVSLAETITLTSDQSNQIFINQVKSNSSVGNAVRTFIARYPERTMDVVEIALNAYPDRYREIISASVSAQPSFVDEILELALERELAEPTELLKLAINAEPSYAEYAAEAACKFAPEDFNDLVKTAVNLEPDSADQIAKKLASSYPSKALDILVTTIQEVPLVGKYVVDALLALFPNESEESESMIIISVEQLAMYPEAVDRLIALANERGIEQSLIHDSAVRGGLSGVQADEYIALHYPLDSQ